MKNEQMKDKGTSRCGRFQAFDPGFRLGWLSVAVMGAGLGLSGCGGSDSHDDSRAPSQLSRQSLVPAGSEARFDAYLKTGLQNVANQRQPYTQAPTMEDADLVGITGASGEFGMSGTNLIEAGVDEADWIKQNDTHIFAMENRPLFYLAADDAGVAEETPSQFTLKIYAKPGTEPLSILPLNGVYNQGIYLSDTTLASVATQQMAQWYFDGIAATQNAKTAVDLISVENPASPAVQKHYEWDGDFVTSRRIDDSLYVVTRYGMDMGYVEQFIDPAPGTDPAQNTSVSQEIDATRLPVTANGQVIDRASCLIPQQMDEANITPSLILITQISLSEQFEPRVTCVAASSTTVYAGLKSLYLFGQDWAGTATSIHKFAFAEGEVDYRATGSVPGYIDWASPGYGVSEHNDVLRMLTVNWVNETNEYKIFTLAESPSERGGLDKLGELPNASRPETIGKPGETVRSVRFIGDQAYIVTFLQTDPLYKLDLSNPTDPKMAGTLEIPGYSAYLQPITEQYLLGVGYSADENGRETGILFSVFDFTQDEPQLVSQQSIEQPEGTWLNLPLAWDNHAISSVSNGDQTRLLVPYMSYADTGLNQLARLEINETSGVITPPAIQTFPDKENTTLLRSLLDGNDVYSWFDDGTLDFHEWGAAE